MIGEGGMASVYEAEHEMLGTKVAIKVLNPILSANAQIKERFRNEARIMASLDHPSITKVLDFDEQPQQLSIVMEFLDGEDLNQKIKRNGALNEKEVTEIFCQTLSAFQYAHEKGVVHRDIKPSNIFILPDCRVKILDFGIAKLFGQGNEMTQTGTQMGTPIYMSPEQVKADKLIDYRSDIYSLGGTMYYAINGKPPYDSNTDSQFDIFTKIVYETLPEFSIQSKFKNIILKACQKNREERFQTCLEFIQAITLSPLNHLGSNDKTIVHDKNLENTKVEDSRTSDRWKDPACNLDSKKNSPNKEKKKSLNYPLIFLSTIGLLFLIYQLFFISKKDNNESVRNSENNAVDSLDLVSGGMQDSVTFSLEDQNSTQEKVKVINDEIEWIDQHNGYFTDSRCNNKYDVIKIGAKIWMAENFRFKSPKSKEYSGSENDNYGRLYQWQEAKNFAPDGWRLPHESDYQELINQYPNRAIASKELSSNGKSGFNALLGIGTSDYEFYSTGSIEKDRKGHPIAQFWIDKLTGYGPAYFVLIDPKRKIISYQADVKSHYFSVRYVKIK